VRVRRIRDGRLDPTFGESGIRDLEDDVGSVRCDDLAESGGRVLVLTTVATPSRTTSRTTLIALDRSGAVDPSFADAGMATVGPPGTLATKLAVDPGGGRTLISAGSFTSDTSSTAVVFGLTSNGDADPTFGEGDGGLVTVPVSGTSNVDSVWRLADGRILVVGSLDQGVQDRWFVARYIP
jgi:hypothetical protein